MANHNWQPLMTLRRGIVELAGSFQPNGTGAPASLKTTHGITSVARSDVGDFLVTFDDGYSDLVCATASLQQPSQGDPNAVKVGPYDASAKTLHLYLYDTVDGSAADLAEATNLTVNFRCTFFNGVDL